MGVGENDFEFKMGVLGWCESYLVGWVDACTILWGFEILRWVSWQDCFGAIVCVSKMLIWSCVSMNLYDTLIMVKVS